jgi:molybdenum cofactor biosynthesis protein B
VGRDAGDAASLGACEDAWDGTLKFQLDNRHRPSSFIELMPRLTESKKKKAKAGL